MLLWTSGYLIGIAIMTATFVPERWPDAILITGMGFILIALNGIFKE